MSDLVYTQEMKDKGITPTNGMLCRVKSEWLFVGTNSYGNWVLENCESGEIAVFTPGQVKPVYILEKKQIDEIYINCVVEGVNISKTCLRWLQEQGYLAEIVKPLEK